MAKKRCGQAKPSAKSSAPQKREVAIDHEPVERAHKMRRYGPVGTLVDASAFQHPGLSTCLRCELYWGWSADDVSRQSAALSLYVDSMLSFGESMEVPERGLVVKEHLVDDVKLEFSIYKGSLHVLNRRHKIWHGRDSMLAVVSQAAQRVYELLQSENAVMQGFLHRRGFAFYAAMCSDKFCIAHIARAFGGISRDAFVAAAISLFEHYDVELFGPP